MEETTTISEKNVKRAKIVINIVLVIAGVAALALIGLVLYDIIGLGYGWDQIVEQVKGICNKAYVWGTGMAVAAGGIVSAASVQIASIVASSTNFIAKVKAVNLKFDSVYDGFSKLLSSFVKIDKNIIDVYNKKLEAANEREVLMGEMLNMLIDSCLDPSVKEAYEEYKEKLSTIDDTCAELDASLKEATNEFNALTNGESTTTESTTTEEATTEAQGE